MALFLGWFVALPLEARTNVPVYPEGHEIECSYSLSTEHLAVADTLVITRTLQNDGSLALSGLYFADNLPREFTVIDHLLSIDDIEEAVLTIGPTIDLIETSFSSYLWVVDSGDADSGIDRVIEPSEFVQLTLKVICEVPGQYQFSTHSTVFYTQSANYFATSPPSLVTFLDAVGVNENRPAPALNSTLTTSAFPNPFNPIVTIEFSAPADLGDHLLFTVFDQRGRLVTRFEAPDHARSGRVSWRPDDTVGSGVYFYRITLPGYHGHGKIVLLK